ncbi:MAG: bifunctional 3-(3-hydroxy-phenyl)propionate/3-hydroxycinnamic acid hydroxylase [Rhizobiaceae bacterium]|nr:bifunctional 3-(3-hydroxy-phenyl)propionate/3-hydroxycinnamic acid hydroxylase [Rhizobiaceae bacterium]
MPETSLPEYDLAIIGAGPVGLTLASFVGQAGLRVLVVEQLPALIDYPRGVGMDDECLRTFQAIGLADAVSRHTTPHQWMEFRTARGKTLALIKPQTTVFGWPRRNAFIQPLVDKVLFEGLARYPNVEIAFSTELKSLVQDGGGVTLHVAGGGGAERAIHCRYLVGCDGGRSLVRKSVDIPFEGQTEATRWIVVDLEDDPVGVPNTILYCDPARPFVSIALPHAVRRLEFMVMAGETEETLTSETGLRGLLGRIMPHPEKARVIRSRVYTHHSRIADTFRSGKVLIAGDAAHLMPVWQGQGYNSGIRDANNLAWKLIEVLQGRSDERLLDSYTAERRAHAGAMIRLSTTAGRIFSPTNRVMAVLRDVLFSAMKYVPPVRDYIVQMRFKPMPTYEQGVVVHGADGDHVVGRMFPQPAVRRADGSTALLDDVIGNRFAILSWAVDPGIYMGEAASEAWRRLGGRTIIVRPPTESAAVADADGHETVCDHTLALKDWFANGRVSTVVIRPDRFIAAAGGPQQIDGMIGGLGDVLFATPDAASAGRPKRAARGGGR